MDTQWLLDVAGDIVAALAHVCIVVALIGILALAGCAAEVECDAHTVGVEFVVAPGAASAIASD